MLNTMILYRATMVRNSEHGHDNGLFQAKRSSKTGRGAMIAGSLLALAATAAMAEFMPTTIV